MNLKFFLILIVFITSISLIISQNVLAQNEFKTFNGEFVNVDYPATWSYKIYGNPVNVELVTFDEKFDQSPSKVVLGKVVIGATQSEISNFDEIVARENSSDINIESLEVEKENVYLAGYPAVKINAIVNAEFVSYKSVMFSTIVNNTEYFFQVILENDEFSEYSSIFQKMISSFNIVN